MRLTPGCKLSEHAKRCFSFWGAAYANSCLRTSPQAELSRGGSNVKTTGGTPERPAWIDDLFRQEATAARLVSFAASVAFGAAPTS